VWLTVAARVFLGLEVWVSERNGWLTAGLHDLFAFLVGLGAAAALLLVPLVVGRWWMFLALVGPAISLTVMQIAGFQVRLDDTTGPAWNYRTVFMLTVCAFIIGFALAVRIGFDVRREDRTQSDQPG
jgi:hypothetical protein